MGNLKKKKKHIVAFRNFFRNFSRNDRQIMSEILIYEKYSDSNKLHWAPINHSASLESEYFS